MPMEALQVMLSTMSQSIQVLTSLAEKAKYNWANCHKLAGILTLLKPLFDDIRNSNMSLMGPIVGSLEALDVALNKARELVERCGPNSSAIYMVLCNQRFHHKFEDISLQISHIVGALPFSSLHLSDQTQAQIEQCMQELQRVRYACECWDEQTAADVENAMRNHREGLKVSHENLKTIMESLGLISNQEVLREAYFLEKEREYARIEGKKEEDYINEVIGIVTQMCEYMVELKQAQTEAGVPIPADFRCPLSLELMSDPVIVASGQTYERAYIQQWLDQGMTTCPKTRQTLGHKNLIPNYTVKALIANWCESNNVPLPEPAKLVTHAPQRSQTINLDSDDGVPSSFPGEVSTNRISVNHPAPQSVCSHHVPEKENMEFLSGSGAEQGESSVQSGPLIDGEHQIPVTEENLCTNHVHDQSQGHSRNVSVSSVNSSLDDGQTSTGGDANVSEVHRAFNDSPYSSDVSGELTSSSPAVGSQHSDMGPPRLPEKGSYGMRIPNLWGRRTEDRNSIPRIISSPVADAGADGSSIHLQVEKLVEDLQSNSVEVQRAAAEELRLLAKFNMENRITIANCGATRPLVALLDSTDPRTQENAVTALLNLSINDNNKNEIAAAGAIDPLINVLRVGNPEARENAAATLFSLSVMEENKISIGQSGAIPPLVDLLMNGTPRGKKDAATALFNLSILHENKARIVRAGAVRPLVDLMNPAAGMVDKAVAVLANLATIPEGRAAIGDQDGISALVEVVELGSQRGKENAAAALLQLCTNSNRFRAMVLQEGAIPPLVALSQSGTPRAREKAQALLRHFRDQRHAVLGRGGAERHMDRHFDRT